MGTTHLDEEAVHANGLGDHAAHRGQLALHVGHQEWDLLRGLAAAGEEVGHDDDAVAAALDAAMDGLLQGGPCWSVQVRHLHHLALGHLPADDRAMAGW